MEKKFKPGEAEIFANVKKGKGVTRRFNEALKAAGILGKERRKALSLYLGGRAVHAWDAARRNTADGVRP